ncbi:hypothetical protein [Micromonospora lutea]|uniref:Uncharacterized protein n=1 Tax=Micromonospora lutea TaxID=419825 RepID=A0ABQ4IQG0_9ACTN|nr:hypothetical protein [Micromonospora lutea]GIJ20154.1 hypothetical protein Vlu01_07780 [Micromonospora lutea]
MRKFSAAVGALCLSVGLSAIAPAPASAKDREGPRAVCQHRLCLFILDTASDRDGDGVTDLDEKKLGTDPQDARSYPEPQRIFDLAIARTLPSFERHLTELVVLPRDTPDGKALATAAGALAVPEKGPIVHSVDGFLGTLRSNGFEHLGRGVTTVLTGEPKLRTDQKLAFAAFGNVAVWGLKGESIEGIVGATNFGVNGHKRPTGFDDRGFTYGERPGSFGRDYSVGYSDGSWDNVRVTNQTQTTTTTGTIATDGYDAEGNFLGSGETTYRQVTETFEDGSSLDDFFSTTINWDQGGNQTERITVTVLTDTYANGSTETTTVTTHYDENDNPTLVVKTTTTEHEGTTTTTTTTVTYKDGEVESSETEETCEGADCPDDSADDETGMPNPDNVGTGPITGDDLARVLDRLNSNRTPSQDDYGQIDISNAEPPSDGLGPLILTANPDGVMTLAVGGQTFFNRAHPEYDPNLQEVIDLSGTTPPSDTDPISWPLP